MPRPPVRDVISVVEHVRRTGSVEYPLETVPAPFEDWRRKVRAEARRVGLRISVRRVNDLVLVFTPDHELSIDERSALADVIAAVGTDTEVDFDTAVQRRRRARLTVVRDEPSDPPPTVGP